MSALFTKADFEAIGSTVARFCADCVAPVCARPERTLSAEELKALTQQAVMLGILNNAPDEAFGLWEHTNDASARARSVATLRAIANVNAGVAFHLHGLALARWLERALGWSPAEECVLCLQGAWGLGRVALSRCLQGAALDAQDSAFLLDYFGCDQPRALLLQAADSWRQLIVVGFEAASQRLIFSRCSRDALDVQRLEHSHGLDETASYAFVQRAPSAPSAPQPAEQRLVSSAEQARELYASALC